jgi:hypothetical protein
MDNGAGNWLKTTDGSTTIEELTSLETGNKIKWEKL